MLVDFRRRVVKIQPRLDARGFFKQIAKQIGLAAGQIFLYTRAERQQYVEVVQQQTALAETVERTGLYQAFQRFAVDSARSDAGEKIFEIFKFIGFTGT